MDCGHASIRYETRIAMLRYEIRHVFLPTQSSIYFMDFMAVSTMIACMQFLLSGEVHRESKATAQLKDQAAGNASSAVIR